MMGSSILLLREFTILLVTGRVMVLPGALGGDSKCHIPWSLALRDLLPCLVYILSTQPILELLALVSWLWLHAHDWCYWSVQEQQWAWKSPVMPQVQYK